MPSFDPATVLGARPPQPINPMADIAQILQLRQAHQLLPLKIQEAQQAAQENALKLQEMQQAQQEHLDIKQAINDSGGDIEKAVPNILKVAPATGLKFVTAVRQQQEAEHKARGEELKNALTSTDLMSRVLQGVSEAADPAAAYQQSLKIAQALGLDHGQMSPTYDPEQVKMYLASGLSAKEKLQRADDELKNEIARRKEARDAAEFGPALEKKQQDAISARQEVEGTKPITLQQKAQMAFQQQQLERELNANLETARHNRVDENEARRYHNLSVEGVELTPEATLKMAEMFASTGVLPNLGMGKAAAKNRSDIINLAAQKFPQVDFASNKAAFQANTASLKSLQTTSDKVDSFEQTAGKNIDLFLKTAGKIIDTGSPLLNRPARMVSETIFGSQNMAAFKAARETALTEAAKVLESPGGNQALTVSGRDSVKVLSDPNATLGQQVNAMKVLRQDMANRKQSNADTIEAIKQRITQSNPNAPPPTAAPKATKRYNPATGQIEDIK